MADEMDLPASAIIAAFGGIRPMATKLGVPVSTVQGWKQRDTIPQARLADIRRIADENQIQMPSSEKPVIEATAITLPDSSSDDQKERSQDRPDPEKPEPVTKPTPQEPVSNLNETAGGKTSAVAVLALIISIGASGWLWWSTIGPGAGGDDNARMSALEGRIARVAETTGDPGKAEREAIAKQLTAMREELNASSPPDLSVALKPIREEITGLQQKIAQLGEAGIPAENPELDKRLSELSASLRQIEQNAADNRQVREDAINRLEGRLTALDAQLTGLRNDGVRQDTAAVAAISLTMAAAQLRRDVERGGPYREALNALAELSPKDAPLDDAVKTLAKSAEPGAISREDLVFSFDETVVGILDSASTDAESSFTDKVLDRARRVVRIRRVGTDVPPDSLDGKIARAELRLRDGDVAGAVTILGALEGPAAEAAQPWMSRAMTFVETEDALETIEKQALARLRAAGGS